jgi:hypothetical protein
MRVMSAGDGYKYLLRTVASADGKRPLSTPLTRYYAEAGTPPGRWLGSGLPALADGRIDAGSRVSEAQLELLLGRPLHAATVALSELHNAVFADHLSRGDNMGARRDSRCGCPDAVARRRRVARHPEPTRDARGRGRKPAPFDVESLEPVRRSRAADDGVALPRNRRPGGDCGHDCGCRGATLLSVHAARTCTLARRVPTFGGFGRRWAWSGSPSPIPPGPQNASTNRRASPTSSFSAARPRRSTGRGP